VGSIPDSVIGIFHRHNPSSRTMTLGSTHSLTEMSTRSISWGLRWTVRRAHHLTASCSDCLEIWGPPPPGTLSACQACNGIALPLSLLRICVYARVRCTALGWLSVMLIVSETNRS